MSLPPHSLIFQLKINCYSDYAIFVKGGVYPTEDKEGSSQSVVAKACFFVSGFFFPCFSLTGITGKSSSAKITVVQFKTNPGQLVSFHVHTSLIMLGSFCFLAIKFIYVGLRETLTLKGIFL